jgi:asparagine synthase (glutamine-hydrolysing)
MCGLTGYYSPQPFPRAVAENMGAALHHRGPDDAGIFHDTHAGLTLVHRRLSILDLSPGGHQPMHSPSKRYVIVFNGEIYNHQALRQQIPSVSWRGTSDTETLLACIDHWGIEKTLQHTIGMFALALWDKYQRQLTLARDRMGEKPLYYGWQGNSFLFGSELKALRQHPDFTGDIERNALTLLLRHNYIPSPYTIYQGIHKLPPGCYLTLDLAQPVQARQHPTPVPYWSLKNTTVQARQTPFTGTDQEALDGLEKTLSAAIQRQQIADVPLGAFLSGGIDSSTIVALMQANSDRPVNTFTIGFNDQQYNEAKHAAAIAKHLGTQHTELYIDAQDAMDVIPQLPTLYDEPFADSSQIPTHLVAKLTRQHVTVALSGDAGDELFAGYNRYFWVQRIWQKIAWLPHPLRKKIAQSITLFPPHQWDKLNQLTHKLQPKSLRSAQFGDKLHKLAVRIENTRNINQLYYQLVSEWAHPEAVVLNSQEPPSLLTTPEQWPDLDDHREQMMYLDSMTYLPDDILTKVDRAAMGVGLETRVPFLDHNVIEFAWRLPMQMKIRDGQSKWLIRQLLYRHVPKTFIERPKMGFSVPLDQWLRHELRDWAEDLLDANKLKQQGFLQPDIIRQRWDEHLSGARNWYYSLWSILMFQSWLNSIHYQ